MIRRFVQGLITLWVLSVVIFLLSRATGNPADLLLPLEMGDVDRDRMLAALGLDRPLYVQYLYFLTGALTGNLGTSIRMNTPVVELLFARLPNSAQLVAVAMAMAVFIALPLGVLAAVRRGTSVDRGAQMLAVMGMAAPPFWVGLVLMQFVSVRTGLLPVSGMGSPQHYVLPAFCLGIFIVAGFVRLTRSSMLDVLDSEYVKLARIKGLSERVIVWKHSFRNALIPVLSFASVYFAQLIGGAIVVETVFAWPGVGRLSYEAIMGRDYPLLQGVVILIGTITIAVNLLVDILYAYIDPRIRYG